MTNSFIRSCPIIGKSKLEAILIAEINSEKDPRMGQVVEPAPSGSQGGECPENKKINERVEQS